MENNFKIKASLHKNFRSNKGTKFATPHYEVKKKIV